MHEIRIDDKVLGYEKDVREISKYLLKEESIEEVWLEGDKRFMRYSNGQIMTIEKTDKSYGSTSGDICAICKQGILRDYGGCATCESCGAQIKCGL